MLFMHSQSVRNSHSLLGLTEYFDTQPNSIALITGAEQTTYGELAEMSAVASRYLWGSGLRDGHQIAVHAAKSPQSIALIVACLMTGRPCLLPSTELGLASLGTLLDRAGCHDLLKATETAPAGIHVSHMARTPTSGDSAHDADTPAIDAAFILTTSGSTGVPKIVPLSAAAVDRFVAWAVTQFDLSPGSAVLNYAPLNFDLCLLDIWATLSAGGTAVLVRQERATDGRYLAETIRAQQISVIQAVPMLFRLLADADRGHPFDSVRHVIITGEKIPARLLTEMPQLFPRARIYNLYGCTETNDSFIHEVTRFDNNADLPIGRPLPGVDIVVTRDHGSVLHGPGEGELLVRTPFQTAGYVGTIADSGSFIDIDGSGRPYFRSGDRVQRDEAGVYTLLGRNDFQVKIRGIRVNIAEIEHVLLSHDQVIDAAVVAVADDNGQKRLHALVRCNPGSVNSLALRDHCRLRLLRAAIPSTVMLVDHALPTTPTGKVDRQATIRAINERAEYGL